MSLLFKSDCATKKETSREKPESADKMRFVYPWPCALRKVWQLEEGLVAGAGLCETKAGSSEFVCLL